MVLEHCLQNGYSLLFIPFKTNLKSGSTYPMGYHESKDEEENDANYKMIALPSRREK